MPALAVERTEELRLALVMNGGVSLAVWIGGVAHEINRFVGETHPVYRGLLELTETRARVDVVSGTSAGGVNGAALALACVYDTSVFPLRDLWLTKGGFVDLLRDPDQADPPSLLDGDGYFLPVLQEAFEKLTHHAPRPAEQAPMSLTMTATMLRGELCKRPDDLGEMIEDGNYRARFQLTRSAHASNEQPDPFSQSEQVARRVAEASRASASFPVAFEPRLYPASQFTSVASGRVGHQDRYLIDGGVLDNKPLDAALDAIFSMPARTNVRRVLAYVVPDPASQAAARPDLDTEPPSLTEVTLASLLGIPSAQSIADQLREITEHNTAVRRRRHTFAWLAANLRPAELAAMSAALLPAYRSRRLEGLLDYVLDSINDGLLARGEPALGRRTREWLKASWRRTDGDGAAWRWLIPTPADAFTFQLEAEPASGWSWGLYAVRFVGSVVLDLLRRTQRLYHVSEARFSPLRPALPSRDADDGVDWDARDVQERNLRAHQGPVGPSAPAALAPLWERLYAVLGDPTFQRHATTGRIRELAGELSQLIARADQGQGVSDADWTAFLMKCVAPSEQERAVSAKHARELARVLRDLEPIMGEVIRAGVGPHELRTEEQSSITELTRLYELFFGEGAPPLNALATRLLQLEVVHYSIAGRSDEIDTAVELVQISGRGRGPWGGPATPSEKLTGMQLGHFGAFYRKAWRANDWMMGRLDAIERIVRIALNPERLHRCYAARQVRAGDQVLDAADYVARFVRALAIDAAPAALQRELEPYWRPDAVAHELAFLRDRSARVPETLPACAEALTRRLHLEVLCKELPEIARSAEDDVAGGAADGAHSSKLVQRMRWGEAGMSPHEASGALAAFPVGSELLRQEQGTDLMARTAAQTVVVVQSALTGKRSGLPEWGGVLKALTLPVRMFQLLAARLTRESRVGAAVASSLLVAGVLLVIGSVVSEKQSESWTVAGWSMLLGWFATALVLRRHAAALVVVAVLGTCFVATSTALALKLLAGVVLLAVAIWAPSWALALLVSLVVLWWTAGHPELGDVAAAVCELDLPLVRCSAQGDASRAQTLLRGLVPLVVVLVLAFFSRLSALRRVRAKMPTALRGLRARIAGGSR